MKFQDKLQMLRKQHGISQEKLAEKVGISRQAVAKWEVGQSYPDIDKIIILSDLFKVSIDTYLGGEKFAGEEAVWCDNVPFWSMNYIGRIIANGFSGDFLRECLLLASKESPYRGPAVYQKGDYKYHCIVNGEFEWFNGYEEIFCNDIKVYECIFHGGCIK